MDEVTRDYLIALLTVVTQVADMQYDDTSRDAVLQMVKHLAEHFDIPLTVFEITVDEHGEIEETDLDEPEDPGTLH